MSSPYQWIWSSEHNDNYYVTYDSDGTPVYHWAKNQTQASDNTNTGAQQPPGHTYGYQLTQASQHPSQYQQQTDQVQYRQSEPQHLQQHGGYQAQASQTAYSQGATSYSQHTGVSASYAAVPDSNEAEMPEPIPSNIRSMVPGLINGTPQRGWYESLDSNYRMRTGPEAHQFFQRGRVFSMLFAEAASETAARQLAQDEDSTVKVFRTGFTPGRFGQYVYSTIRRFVIVKVKERDHFVYACPIYTYSGRGATKPGCRASDHTIVYFEGTKPTYIGDELVRGMTKEPIEIVPTTPNDTMDPASRLRFGKTFPIEWNVKVKEIGKVSETSMRNLVEYYMAAE